MLDAAVQSLESGDAEQAAAVIRSALERHRETIRQLRDLSFALEPVVLRDQGFVPAVRALADQIGLDHEIQVEVDVDAAEALAEKAQAALYQILRDALHSAVRRGPPKRIAVNVRREGDGAIETVIVDDAPGERRRATFDPIAERARSLNGRLDVEHGADGGTIVRVHLPSYVSGD